MVLAIADFPLSTRGKQAAAGYRFEMTDNEHRDMAAALHRINGMAIVSGYPCDLYDRELFVDWRRIEREAYAEGARDRTEVLWLSPRTSAALRDNHEDLPLFGG